MTVNYELGGLVLGVLAFSIPILYKPVRDEIRKRRQMRKLKWKDVPDGRIHECPPLLGTYLECTHYGATSFACIFNRAWRQKPLHTGNVPLELPQDTFICTDARTVLTFLLLTSPERKGLDWCTSDTRMSFGSSRLAVESKGEIQIAYVEGEFKKRNATLTKKELTCLLDGFPPWFREIVTTRDGFDFPFPITSFEDISRAGWIIAIALRDSSQCEPFALYRENSASKAIGRRDNAAI